MEQTSQRAIRAIDPAGDIADLMARLAAALEGNGPALSLGEISVTHVESEITLVMPTSGSTGQPREVGLSANSLIASARSANKFLDASLGDVWSLLLPVTHIAGINVLLRSLQCGSTPIDARGISGKYPKVDFTAVVPTQLYRALDSNSHLLDHLLSAKSVLVGGSALDSKLRERAISAGIKIVESYGMTETSGGCVYDGVALEGVFLEISEAGNIKISGACIASGYINDSRLWNEKFQDGYFESSDIGEIRDGKLFVLGRSDDIIISGGENISLIEIETVIKQAYPANQIAAFAITDSEWGQILHLAIAGKEKPDKFAINELLVNRISKAAKIKSFIYLDNLPRTPLDKIDRSRLIEIAQGKET